MTIRRSLAALVLLPLALAACAADDEMSSESDNSEQPAAGAPDAEGGGEVKDSAGDGSIDIPAFPEGTDRLLIVRMTVGLEVVDVGAAVEALLRVAEAHDAQLSSSSVDITDERYASGQLVFRLPPVQVDPFIDGLDPAVGRTASLDGSTEDVTRQIRDLDAQIEAAEISVDRVRSLLEGATKLADVILLEGELTARQTNLEQLRALKADLDQQVALATVTVSLWTSPDDPTDDDGVLADIGDAFARGWDAFVAALVTVVLVLGYTAPFMALGAIVVGAWLVIRRVRRNRSAAPPTPPAPAGDPHTS
jgi:hypothetical protein